MRVDIRSPRWALAESLREATRDRIRLAIGREAPALLRVRVTFTPPCPKRPEAALRLVAVLRDGRSLELEDALPASDDARMVEAVDRLAHRMARGVQRSLSAAGMGPRR